MYKAPVVPEHCMCLAACLEASNAVHELVPCYVQNTGCGLYAFEPTRAAALLLLLLCLPYFLAPPGYLPPALHLRTAALRHAAPPGVWFVSSRYRQAYCVCEQRFGHKQA